MLNYYDLRRGVQFIMDGQPHEVLEFQQIKKARAAGLLQAKIKNLITGKVLERTFHQGDTFEETEIERISAKFIYANKDKFVFAQTGDPSKRFELEQSQIGDGAKFLAPNMEVEANLYDGQIIGVNLPIKVQLKVKEAAPGVKGNRAQSGTKAVVLETGATMQAPLFVQVGDILEINTQTGEYSKRV